MSSYSFFSDPRDHVLFIGFTVIVAGYLYVIATGPWENPIANLIIYGMVGFMIVVPFTPWFKLQLQRWRYAE